MPQEQPITWLTIKEAAELFHLHPNTIRNAINSGKLPASRFGLRAIRIQLEDLNALFTPFVRGEYSQWNR